MNKFKSALKRVKIPFLISLSIVIVCEWVRFNVDDGQPAYILDILSVLFLAMPVYALYYGWRNGPWEMKLNAQFPFKNVSVWYDKDVNVIDKEVFEDILNNTYQDFVNAYKADIKSIKINFYIKNYMIKYLKLKALGLTYPQDGTTFISGVADENLIKQTIRYETLLHLCEEVFPGNDESLDIEFLKNTNLI